MVRKEDTLRYRIEINFCGPDSVAKIILSFELRQNRLRNFGDVGFKNQFSHYFDVWPVV